MTTEELAFYYCAKRHYSNPLERASFCVAFERGWNGDPDNTFELHLSLSEWPNAYSAGYWEGVHAKEKAITQ